MPSVPDLALVATCAINALRSGRVANASRHCVMLLLTVASMMRSVATKLDGSLGMAPSATATVRSSRIALSLAESAAALERPISSST